MILVDNSTILIKIDFDRLSHNIDNFRRSSNDIKY